MKLAEGPRPVVVRAFAALCLLAALAGLYESLIDFGFLHGDGSWHVPADESTRIRAVSLTSARLCIALIPLAFIWFFASTIARWMVLIFSVLKVWATLTNLNDASDTPAIWVDVPGIVVAITGAVAAAFLFSPAASRWFTVNKRRVEAVFE